MSGLPETEVCEICGSVYPTIPSLNRHVDFTHFGLTAAEPYLWDDGEDDDAR